MAILKLIRYPDPSLRWVCDPAELSDALSEHLRDLKDTLESIPHGLALASNQVQPRGVRAFVVRPSQGLPGVVINPEWRPAPTITGISDMGYEQEGCLSIPGSQLSVPRYQRIIFWWQDEKGASQATMLEGLPARIVQHECEHLNGGLIVDHTDTRTRVEIRTKAIKNRKMGR